jgi:hypothetical protein
MIVMLNHLRSQLTLIILSFLPKVLIYVIEGFCRFSFAHTLVLIMNCENEDIIRTLIEKNCEKW